MRDVMLQTEWNTHHFAVGGCIAGAAYAFLICDLVGLLSLASMSAVFIGVVVGGLAGALIAGGVAAMRNYFTNTVATR